MFAIQNATSSSTCSTSRTAIPTAIPCRQSAAPRPETSKDLVSDVCLKRKRRKARPASASICRSAPSSIASTIKPTPSSSSPKLPKDDAKVRQLTDWMCGTPRGARACSAAPELLLARERRFRTLGKPGRQVDTDVEHAPTDAARASGRPDRPQDRPDSVRTGRTTMIGTSDNEAKGACEGYSPARRRHRCRTWREDVMTKSVIFSGASPAPRPAGQPDRPKSHRPIQYAERSIRAVHHQDGMARHPCDSGCGRTPLCSPGPCARRNIPPSSWRKPFRAPAPSPA